MSGKGVALILCSSGDEATSDLHYFILQINQFSALIFFHFWTIYFWNHPQPWSRFKLKIFCLHFWIPSTLHTHRFMLLFMFITWSNSSSLFFWSFSFENLCRVTTTHKWFGDRCPFIPSPLGCLSVMGCCNGLDVVCGVAWLLLLLLFMLMLQLLWSTCSLFVVDVSRLALQM